MKSVEIFENIINEFNSIKDIIEKNKDLSPSDVPYILNKINNRVDDIREDWDYFNIVAQEEEQFGIR